MRKTKKVTFRNVTLVTISPVFVFFCQYKDREGEARARQAAWDDPHRDHRGRNRRGDGEGTASLSAPDVRGKPLFTSNSSIFAGGSLKSQ